MKNWILLLLGAVTLSVGCASPAQPKPLVQRGWIGGEFRETKGRSVPSGQRRVVYVKQIYAGTPAETAGLKPADLILSINGHSMARLAEFRRCIDTLPVGNSARFKVMRAGQTLEMPVTVGRETYQQWHAIQMGFGLASRFDLWPKRDFSLLGLVRYKCKNDRLELRSPEVVLTKSAEAPSNSPQSGEVGTFSDEGWSFWLVLFGCDAHKRILSQEPVASQSARREP